MSAGEEVRIGPVVNGASEITICAGARRNALNVSLLSELVDAVGELAANESCRVVVVRAEGAHFCAGWDVKDFARLASMKAGEVSGELRLSHSAFQKLRAVPAVTLGAVRGTVAGAGVGLLRALHVVVASTTTRIGLPEVVYGIIPAGVMVDLLDLPSAIALDLLLTGEAINAERALGVGLVSRVTSDENLDDEVDRLAATLASRSAATVRSLLETFHAIAPQQKVSSYLRAYQASAQSVVTMSTNDAREPTP